MTKPISSKVWKSFTANENRNFPSKGILSNSGEKFSSSPKSDENFLFERFYNNLFSKNMISTQGKNGSHQKNIVKKDLKKHLSKKDLFVQRYKMFLYSENQNSPLFSKFEKEKSFQNVFSNDQKQNAILFSQEMEKNQTGNSAFLSEELPLFSLETVQSKNVQNSVKNFQSLQNASQYRPMTLLHPFQFYFQKEQALKRKFQFYGVKLFRNFGVENNGPYFRVLMKRFFYHYKPSLRWERTLRVATYRRARRKTSRIPRKFNVSKTSQIRPNS